MNIVGFSPLSLMSVLQANAHLLLSKVLQAFEANLQRQMPPDQAPVGGGGGRRRRLSAELRSRAGATSASRTRYWHYWRRDPNMGFYLRDARAKRRGPGAHACQ